MAFLPGGGTGQSDFRQILGQQLMRQGATGAPVRTLGQGLGQLGQTLMGAWQMKQSQDRQQASLAEVLAAAEQGDLSGLAQSDNPYTRQAAAPLLLQQAMTDRELMQTFDPETGAPVYTRRGDIEPGTMAGPRQAPQTRQVFRGGTVVTEQFDPATGEFVEIGSGSRWQPQASSETFSIVSGDQATELGFAPGTVLQVGSRGSIDVLQEAPGGGANSRDAEIAALVARGVPQHIAAGVADGNITLSTDPVTGGRAIVDVATGRSIGVQDLGPEAWGAIESTAAPQGQGGGARFGGYSVPEPREVTGETIMSDLEPVPEDQTLYSLADEATGVGPSIGRTAQRTVGQVGGLEGVGSESTRAGQQFTVETNQLIRALSINPRFPVGEIERIRNEISLQPSVLDSPAAMRDRMQVIDRSLRRRIEDQLEAANDPSLPVEARQSARQNARAMAEFVNVMGVPREQEDEPSGGVEGRRNRRDGSREDADIGPPPEGVSETEWRFMTPEERALFQ